MAAGINRGNEVLRADVTMELTSQLDDAVAERYPMVGRQKDALSLFKTRMAPHIAFNVDSTDPVDRASMLHDALTHAANPEDAAYCAHGAEHHVFFEAKDKLLQSIDEFTATYGWQEIIVPDVDRLPVHKKRLIVETPVFQRKTARPEPYILAAEWKKRGNTINVTKEMRMRSSTGADGFASALLSGVFLGMSEEEILTVFDNKQFQENMLKLGYSKNLLLHKKDPKDSMLVRDLQHALTVPTYAGRQPVFDFDSYTKSLALVEKYHLIDANGIARSDLRMREVEEPVIARGVFRGLEEVADKLAPLTLLEPKRTQYIGNRFGKHATTDLLTAFLVFKK